MIRSGKLTKQLRAGTVIVGAAGCLGPGGVVGNDVDEDTVLVGTVSVTAVTTGAAPDTDGYLASLDEARVLPIEPNGTATFESVPVGTYGVRLDDYAGNCTVTPPGPTYVTLLPDSMIATHFAVDCP